MTRAYLSLGANVGDRDATLAAATDGLANAGVRLLRASPLYETAPVGVLDQPPFLNLVLEVESDLDAAALLRATQAVEREFGRVRAERWGPRTLDIDLLWMDGVSSDTPELTLPHPRMAERAFVLVPLADLAPDLPVAGATASALAARRLEEGQRVAAVVDRPRTRYVGKRLYWLTTTPSTNDEARRLAEAGAPEGTAVAARTQTAGRGRLGRRWIAPAGGVWVSIILRPPIGLPEIPRLGLAIGVAVHRAILRSTGVRAGLRWPNDVLLDGRKVGGILAEAGPGGRWVVVGVGINAAIASTELPDGATSLQETMGVAPDSDGLMATLFAEVESIYERFRGDDIAGVLDLWSASSTTLGRRVRVHLTAGAFEGVAESVDEDGALWVRLDDGTRRRVVAGDVT